MAAATTYRREASGALKPVIPADPAAGLLAALIEAGIRPVDPGCIVADGRLHRFDAEGDRRGSRNGWYVLHHDHGAGGSWKAAITVTWTARSRRNLDRAEKDRLYAEIRAAKAAEQRQREAEHAETAQLAAELWERAQPADPNHPYLLKKRIAPGLARQFRKARNALVLRVQDFDGNTRSLQYIGADGSKLLLSGGQKKGNFILVAGALPADVVVVGEGLATCSTIARDFKNAAVLAAIDCGNLMAVATEARRRYPRAKLVIAADDDRLTPGNPGLSKACEAGAAAGATVIRPNWPPGAPLHLSDFNDLHCWLQDAATEREAAHA